MKYLISVCCALLMLVACSKQPDNNIEAEGMIGILRGIGMLNK